MNTLKMSSTAVRNKFFEMLNLVATGTQVIIERDNKEIAVLSSRTTKTDWKGLLSASKKVRGIFKNYKTEDNPLRRKGASDFLGKWDRGL